ncbi:mitochondrial ribosomal protein L16 [Epithele typhae]|uniref:mitochondrial ribosomal protein L16 n=1 Tax=Epithele typhae TaxID=378194 RepID=UPI002008E692|nr:mitochondrial ribosomal protein L16 [Epithele typhae]KAH9941277.1 mitochondrial ribosomal protein L16 [Epithele typhae]
MFSLSSSARPLLAACRPSTWPSPVALRAAPRPALSSPPAVLARGRHSWAPMRVKFIKRHKGVLPVPTGGATKGTTLAHGEWGLRICGHGARITAQQLKSIDDMIKKKLKVIKGAKVWFRVFPDVPVCQKVRGNETRMGKGKGSFEFWATRVAPGRVILEIGGAPVREELARQALRIVAGKLPTQTEFISRKSPPRLGNMLIHPEIPADVNPSITLEPAPQVTA